MRWPHRKVAPPGDPWQTAITQHFATGHAGAGEEPPGEGEPSGKRTLAYSVHVGWIVGGAAVLALALIGAGYLGFLAVRNHDTANEWRDRSVALEGLVADRTKALNRQTARLNTASKKFRASQRSIRRSERDVAELEDRQRELAAEKTLLEDDQAALSQAQAALETQQEALTGVANQMIECNKELFYVVQLLDSGIQPSSSAYRDAEQACSSADSALAAYNDSF